MQRALPVITIMALWQLLNLGTGCTVTVVVINANIFFKFSASTMSTGTQTGKLKSFSGIRNSFHLILSTLKQTFFSYF